LLFNPKPVTVTLMIIIYNSKSKSKVEWHSAERIPPTTTQRLQYTVILGVGYASGKQSILRGSAMTYLLANDMSVQ